MEVRYVGKSVTLDDPPVKYFVVTAMDYEWQRVVCLNTLEEARRVYSSVGEHRNFTPVAIIKGYVIEGSLE